MHFISSPEVPANLFSMEPYLWTGFPSATFGFPYPLAAFCSLSRTEHAPERYDFPERLLCAFILSLDGTHLLGSDLKLVFNRIHFVCTLQATKVHAYTDGALRSKENQRVLAILEVKKRARTTDNDMIVMQEACQNSKPRIAPDNTLRE
jgi:hypothetical protein